MPPAHWPCPRQSQAATRFAARLQERRCQSTTIHQTFESGLILAIVALLLMIRLDGLFISGVAKSKILNGVTTARLLNIGYKGPVTNAPLLDRTHHCGIVIYLYHADEKTMSRDRACTLCTNRIDRSLDKSFDSSWSRTCRCKCDAILCCRFAIHTISHARMPRQGHAQSRTRSSVSAYVSKEGGVAVAHRYELQ